MRFMMLMYPGPRPEAGEMPCTERMEEMMRFNEELVRSGALLAADGLHPTSRGARVRKVDGEVVVTDGPFTETKEILGGYWMIQAASMEEALAWARRIPLSSEETVEVRRVFEMEDFDIAPGSELEASAARVDEGMAAVRVSA